MPSFMCLLAICALALLGSVEGHGRLTQPWGRSSLWRDQAAYPGFRPRDYTDNELSCGGVAHQIGQGYKCGICGDPYDEPQPRKHEIGGPYYKGYLVANYTTGSVIDVTVQITANHKGFFQFKLCPVPGFQTEATQECLDRTVLEVAGSADTEYHVTGDVKDFHLQLQLPAHLQCDHCVLQWRYHVGNSWGRCEDGSGALGCGPQEEFYACADVSVRGRDPRPEPEPEPEPVLSRDPRPEPEPEPEPEPGLGRYPGADTAAPLPVLQWLGLPPAGKHAQGLAAPWPGSLSRGPTSSPRRGYIPPLHEAGWHHDHSLVSVLRSRLSATASTFPSSVAAATTTTSVPTITATTTSPLRANAVCSAVPPFDVIPDMNKWCQVNCQWVPLNCPPTHCRCQ